MTSLEFIKCTNCGAVMRLSPGVRKFLYKEASQSFTHTLCILDDIIICCKKPDWIDCYYSHTDNYKTVTEEEFSDMVFTAVFSHTNPRWISCFADIDKLFQKLGAWMLNHKYTGEDSPDPYLTHAKNETDALIHYEEDTFLIHYEEDTL